VGDQTDGADGSVVLHDVTVCYGRRIALDSVSGRFAPGSLTAVVGANGAGKSTLIAAITGAVRLTAGSIEVAAPERLAWLPQISGVERDFPITIAELITVGAWQQFGAFRAPGEAVRARLTQAAATVGLTEKLDRRISQMSVGELQRALFARLMLQDAAVILLDEPFAAVDSETIAMLLDQVMQWHEQGRTVIAVLHDLEMVRRWFPSATVLARRCLAWGATETALKALNA
jgi:zinc/manganese transport system ATP-binding protein